MLSNEDIYQIPDLMQLFAVGRSRFQSTGHLWILLFSMMLENTQGLSPFAVLMYILFDICQL